MRTPDTRLALTLLLGALTLVGCQPGPRNATPPTSKVASVKPGPPFSDTGDVMPDTQIPEFAMATASGATFTFNRNSQKRPIALNFFSTT